MAVGLVGSYGQGEREQTAYGLAEAQISIADLPL
jgi:hypothetical protein